jgi:hypothetical protein
VSRLLHHHILPRRGERASGRVPRPIPADAGLLIPRRAAHQPGLAMTSAIVSYLNRRKSQQAEAQSAASKAAGHRLTSGTWDATAATGERESEDNANKAAEGYRQSNRDEADDLAPARGIAVSVLVGIAMWLAIVAVVLL